MIRQIFLDTETTGLDPRQGHRIIEIAGVEMVNRRSTGRHFHRYLNPQREIDAGAEAVHGITGVFLQDKPFFSDVVDELLEFLSDAELVIHNAPFDIGFLNHELALLGRPSMHEHCANVLDTLKLAKDLHPGQKTISMRSVAVMKSITPTEPCMAHCWMRSSSRPSISG